MAYHCKLNIFSGHADYFLCKHTILEQLKNIPSADYDK